MQHVVAKASAMIFEEGPPPPSPRAPPPAPKLLWDPEAPAVQYTETKEQNIINFNNDPKKLSIKVNTPKSGFLMLELHSVKRDGIRAGSFSENLVPDVPKEFLNIKPGTKILLKNYHPTGDAVVEVALANWGYGAGQGHKVASWDQTNGRVFNDGSVRKANRNQPYTWLYDHCWSLIVKGSDTLADGRGLDLPQNVQLIWDKPSPLVFYENFESQTYKGEVKNAFVVKGGYNGSTHALEGSSGEDGKVWYHTFNDGFPRGVVSISFWHCPVKVGPADIPSILAVSTNNRPSDTSIGMDLIGRNCMYYSTNQKNFKITKWFVNGVNTERYSNEPENVPYNFKTQHRYVKKDIELNKWQHHYIEFSSAIGSAESGEINGLRWFGSSLRAGGRYRGTGKLDEVRYYTKSLSDSQILKLSKGETAFGNKK